MQTLIPNDSPLIAVFAAVHGVTLTQSLVNYKLSNYTLEDVQARTEEDVQATVVNIDPVPLEDPEAPLPPVELTSDPMALMTLSNRTFRALREQQEALFPVPEPEPEPEPRYKTHMTGSEFSRDLLKPEEWEAIELLAQTDAKVATWRNITISGGVWTEHDALEAGIQLAGSLGVWGEGAAKAARMDEIRKGLLIT